MSGLRSIFFPVAGSLSSTNHNAPFPPPPQRLVLLGFATGHRVHTLMLPLLSSRLKLLLHIFTYHALIQLHQPRFSVKKREKKKKKKTKSSKLKNGNRRIFLYRQRRKDQAPSFRSRPSGLLVDVGMSAR